MTVRIIHDTALHALADIDTDSINLIVTDPPYFRVKDAEWDNQWKDADEYLDWINALCAEWQRVLAPNGSLYVFAHHDMVTHIEIIVHQHFSVLSQIVWAKPDPSNEINPGAGRGGQASKDTLREYFPITERIIFAEQTVDQYADISKALHKEVFAPLGRYIQQEREAAGFTRNEVEVALGYVSSDNPERGTALCYRWEEGSSLPTKRDYYRLRELLNRRRNGHEYLARSYEQLQQWREDLRREYEDLRREYEDLRRPFNASPDRPYTDVWTFPTVQAYDGKHECEKPLAMIEHIVRTSSRDDDTVLDCFAGSGVTGEACVNLGRDVILVERDEGWATHSRQRCEAAQQGLTVKEYQQGKRPLFDLREQNQRNGHEQLELTL